MEGKNENSTSLLPIGSSDLTMVKNAIGLTHKILFGDIEEYFNRAFILMNGFDLESDKTNYCLLIETKKNYRREGVFKCKAKRNEDYKESIEIFNKVLLLKPNHMFSYDFRGISKFMLNDYEGAIADYSKTIELDPTNIKAYINRGKAKHALKNYEGAIADYSKAIVIDPNFASAYFHRGDAKGYIGDFEGGIADYSKAAELDPIYSEKDKIADIIKRSSISMEELLKSIV